jgi:hypothetical protein
MIDITKKLVTEDYFVDWIKEQNGILHTRKFTNINNINLSQCPQNTMVCLTGYPNIVSHFFNNIIHKFKNKIILITLETDWFPMNIEYLNHPLLEHWFTWNKQKDHPKLTSIPIGLNKDRHLQAIQQFLSKKPSEKNKFFATNLSTSSNPERIKQVELAKTKWSSFCTFIENIPFSRSYFNPSHIDGKIKIDVTDTKCYDILSEYKFILSPPGAGIDCHRTWEALYTGTVPIVLTSSINELYEDLPVLIVPNWYVITKEFLEQQYEEIQKKLQNNEYNMDKLYFEYWKNMIERKLKQK